VVQKFTVSVLPFAGRIRETNGNIVFLAKLLCSGSDFASGPAAYGLGALKSGQFATTRTSLYHSIG